MPSCYSGPNPVTDEERLVIWKWAKEHGGIDAGMPYEKVHENINHHFFQDMAKPEWITDILSGRKTPFKELATEAWKKQYNRRMIVQAAQARMQGRPLGPVLGTLKKVYDFPRFASVWGHGFVYPFSHAGDLLFRPSSWGTFFRGVLNTYTKTIGKSGQAATERLVESMRRHPLYDLALHSGLDVGPNIHRGDMINLKEKGSQGLRAWDVLNTMRFELWTKAVEKHLTPEMTVKEKLDIGKNMAEWANHATGSGKGFLSNKWAGHVVFGPKLTQSKLNRMVADPVKTIKTLANWNNASAGEKIAARTRLSGLTQYFGTYLGFLAANQGYLKATGQKDDINFLDPTASDWLAFKSNGMTVKVPGLHSEISFLGKMLAASYLSYKWSDPKYRAAMQRQQIKEPFVASHPGDVISSYLLSKGSPNVGLATEAYAGKDFIGTPLPWSPDPGKPGKERLDPVQYILTKSPIPLAGPVRYFYDELTGKGASPLDAVGIIRGLVQFGVGYTGMHVQDKDYQDALKAEAKNAAGRQIAGRVYH